MRRRLAVALLAAALVAAGCGSKKERAETEAMLASFWNGVTVINDPVRKTALLRDDEEPERTKDFLAAHEALRGMMDDPGAKAHIVAAFLAREPTALRVVEVEEQDDERRVTCALDPAGNKTGVFVLRRREEGWKIADFDGYLESRAEGPALGD
ncbi:MAG: hypothetical protein M5R36_01630 [Deltaproteobacteria bacterium]|nr:hypothetical protein [Deltaproteobacteria bacterium]